MKQTAVEWLIEQIRNEKYYTDIDFDQAKEMEKEQIMDAYYYEPNCNDIKDDGEKYYKETFNK